MDIGNEFASRCSIHAEKTNQSPSFNENYRESPSQRMEKVSPQILQGEQPIVVAEEETKRWRQTNPLLIANVVEKIFPYLDHASLKSCRAVSSLWSVMSTPLVRACSQIHLGGDLYDNRGDALFSTFYSSPTTPITDTLPMTSLTYNFHHTPPLSSCILFDRVSRVFATFGHSLTSLTLQAFALQDPANSLDTHHFFSVVPHLVGRDCPSLTHLALTHLQNLDIEGSLDPKTESWLNFTSPSVRHLTIAYKSNHRVRPRRALSVLKCLLAIAPNATSLDTNFGYCGGQSLSYFLTTLRDAQISDHLTSFSLSGGPLDNVSMNALNSMTFPRLTSLKMNTFISAQVQTEFIQFLEKLSPTLEKFVMFGDKSPGWEERMTMYEGGFTVDFPLMPKLKVVEYQDYESLRFGSEDFLQRLPNLGELVIRDVQLSLADLMLSQRTLYGTVFSTRRGEITEKNPIYANVHVKKVVLDKVFFPSSENLGSMEKLLKMFPNVEELELAVSFAYQDVYVGQVLDILAKAKVKKLKIKFLDYLQRVDFNLGDMPPVSRFTLPFYIVKGMLCTKALRVLNLTGFCIGENLEETEMCRQLLDAKLVQWKISESVSVTPPSDFSIWNIY
ncbi:Antagonist of mitotic exit network protein 1 [Folsomia candida]|uniref:Antagonist of mitotic exit network protein 1 n=1 Tax=Folsomia candida TaxID=158441 RepID=A0A226ESX2_FOLCA|nr:Antagonist of mitotic exit network protein 1 [Folsomia candida]